jgi:hypothetical protein
MGVCRLSSAVFLRGESGPSGTRVLCVLAGDAATESPLMCSLHRRNPRRDQGERAIVIALEQAGALVARLSTPGLADLLVCYRSRGYVTYQGQDVLNQSAVTGPRPPTLLLLEVKRPKAPGQAPGRPTKAQTAKTQLGWPSITVATPAEALQAIGCEVKLQTVRRERTPSC